MLKIYLIILSLLFFTEKNLALEIVVSNQPLKKIVKELASEHNIYQIQKEGTDFHFYEPTFSDFEKLKNADLVILVGTESWIKKVYLLRKNKKIFVLSKNEYQFLDPHLWFNLERIEKLVKDLTEYLSEKDSSRKSIYQKRMKEFLIGLNKIKKDYENLKYCKYKEIYILGHPVFGYLLKYSGINQIALVKGYHKEGEPSIKTLREMINKIKTKENRMVFLTDPEFERYKDFFEKQKIEVVTLWSGGSYYMAGSYLELLKYNLKNIEKSLGCKKVKGGLKVVFET